jgi:hypothetical protein
MCFKAFFQIVYAVLHKAVESETLSLFSFIYGVLKGDRPAHISNVPSDVSWNLNFPFMEMRPERDNSYTGAGEETSPFSGSF